MAWNGWYTATVIVFVALFALLCGLATQLDLTRGNGSPDHLGFYAMLVLGILLLVLMVFLGFGIASRWDGILIDSRNRVTLTNFQLVVWTLVVLTAFGAVFLTNLLAGKNPIDAFDFTVPNELWLAMGISGTSYVGAKAIRNTQGQKATTKTNAGSAGMLRRGQLAVRDKPSDASWGDMFAADAFSDGMHVDISKVQMFFFTVVLAVGYLAAVVNLLINATAPVTSLPVLNQAFVIVLVLSHGGYLGRKATDSLGSS
ncbi:MAG TPA: hypothetical protein VMT59_06485 [Gaiellaceae bacterium]|nr:hypothetical protein [Gaiellaceae bacterium]